MKNWGDLVGNYGFISETENYYYVINGTGSSSSDNTFGKPIKGALVAVDKTDLSKKEIVVPKLFVASDYKAGLFIHNDYVYYGTPDTSKDSSGSVAKYRMNFTRTKLDGTNTETLFTVDSHSTEYRIALNGDVVTILYYDTDNSAIMSYSVKTKEATVLEKTNAKTSEMETLKAYKFGANGEVYITTTVYAEKYYSNKDSRAEESYNRLYKLTADGKEKIYDGEQTETVYEIITVNELGLFYKATTNSQTKYYLNDKELASNTDLITENMVIETEGEDLVVYTLNSNILRKSYLTKADGKYDDNIADLKDANTLVKKDGAKIFFYNASNELMVYGMNEEIVRVSEGSVATTWYKPVFIGNSVFYCDTSAQGLSYVKCADLASNIESEDTDEDEKDDLFYLTGHADLGVLTIADQATQFKAKISEFGAELESGVLPYTETAEGTLEVKGVQDLRAEYDALSKAVKEKVSDDTIKTYEKAIAIANLLNKVYGAGDDMVSETEMAEYKLAYAEITKQIEKFIKSDDYATVKPLLKTNMLWHYQQLQELIEEEAKNA